MTEYQETDSQLARRIAVEAAQLLVEVRSEHNLTSDASVAEQRALGDDSDRRSNALILQRLAAARPGDAVLSEEAPDDGVRVGCDRVWIVDPLDGTAEYRTARDEFAVHVALWERTADGAGELTAACIALPDRERVWCTDDAVLPTPSVNLDGPLTLAISRNYLPPGLDVVIERMTVALHDAGHRHASFELARVGSVGAKVDEVLVGKAVAYLFTGGLKEWDAAAPFAVASHQGFAVGDVPGIGFEYNRAAPLIGSGFVCHPALADILRAAVVDSGL